MAGRDWGKKRSSYRTSFPSDSNPHIPLFTEMENTRRHETFVIVRLEKIARDVTRYGSGINLDKKEVV